MCTLAGQGCAALLEVDALGLNADKVIMPNLHGSFKGHSQCLEAAGGRSGERGGTRNSPPMVHAAGSRTPRSARRELTVSLYMRTLLKIMSSACASACCCEARRRGPQDSWWRAAGRCWRVYGVVAYAVMLCALPAATEGFCPTGCVCNYSSMFVSCKGAGLDGVPILLNPRVQDLRLHNNNIRTLAQSLVFYRDLRFLDLSGNDLDSLGGNNFMEQRKLQELRLGHNKLQSVEAKALRGLQGLQKLALHHNVITHLEDGAFEGAGNLTELDLSHNRLRAVGAAGVRGLMALDRLDLSGNRLNRVPGGGLTNIIALRHLNLTRNLISQVPPRAFGGFPALASLVLDRNNISIIAPAGFEAVTELRRLSLADNRLLAVPSSSLAALHRLQHLDISGNLFESLPVDCFRGLGSLESLRVSRCPRLNTVSGEAFLSAGSLHTLQLSHNPRLGALPPAALASMLALRHLDLSACGLRTLTPTQVPLRNLRSLRLAGNPLTCNCSLVWFSRLVADPNASIVLDQPTCASPPALYGVSLSGLDGDQVGCQSYLGFWAAVGGVCVALLVLLTVCVLLAFCWRRRRRRKKKRRSEDDKGCWEDPFLPDGRLSVSRLPSRPLNGIPTHSTLSPLTRLGSPPRLPPTHPLHHHLHHQGCLQQCPYAALHPLYRPLLHPDYGDRGRLSPPTTPSSLTTPPPLPLSDPPNWYATIGGGDGGEDSGRESRPPTPLDSTSSPRKVPVTYV
ncbi:Insulin-like growth factor-binding protein complex acid labile subunit [Chionoecetes opilio]|uniref:Insulin-like growth factor-binding protein complex acid labile subunit n=1 Tax=Chionoecetes opilio TaxID=41210 RepID=A0A8J5CNU5_CHIOP|nr:Insulin-like growth factor-binding protein complex acid labile subunit [Chionoecetes opilio]